MKNKKRYPFLCIMIDLLGIGLIPANLFWFQAPEYITIILAALMVAAFILYIGKRKGNGKRVPKILLGVFGVLSAGFTLFGAYCNPYWNSVLFQSYPYTKEYDTVLTYEEAKEDLDYFMHYLKKDHPKFLDKEPSEVREQYEQAVQELKAASEIDVTFLRQKIQNIASVLEDGHTCSFVMSEKEYYLKWGKSQKDKGYSLVKIEGMELEDMLREKADLYCYEVESWGVRRLKGDLSTLQGLYFLGLNPQKGVHYTFMDEQGNEETVLYKQDDFVTLEEYEAFYEQEVSNSKPFVSYTIDEEKSLAVLTLESCNYNEEYCNCVKEMFTEIKAKGIEHVAVDLRNNGGGNSMVVNEFFKYLNVDTYRTDTCRWRLGPVLLDCGEEIVENKKYSELTFSGSLYCLTSTDTFSSAMMFAEYVKDNQLGTIIGEAPGNAPSGYGDISIFKLPNSRIYAQISTKEFFRADRESEELLVNPDIECDSEKAMEKLFALIGQ